jgi:NADH:ubiquinone oxidoreductase subunit E
MSTIPQLVREIVAAPTAGQPALLQVLLAIQDASPENYVSEEAVNEIAHLLGISRSRVYSTASFYSAISLKPRGRHIVRVCINAPCENAGKQAVLAALEGELGVSLGGTTADGLFTLEGVSCLGACYMSPAIKIDNALYGDLTAETAVAVVRRYREGEKIEHTA